MNTDKIISIIVVNYNSYKYVNELLISLKLYEEDIWHAIQIIIVDNNSNIEEKKNLEQLNKQFDNLKIIYNQENLGFGVANNIGVYYAEAELLLFLNADTIIIKQFIIDLINKMEEYNSDVLGLQLLNSDLSIQKSCGYFPSIRQFIFEMLSLNKINYLKKITKPLVYYIEDECEEVDYVSGACFLIKKCLFENIGGFDKEYFMYFEETDLCKKVKNNNAKVMIYNNKSVVHYGSAVISEFSKFKSDCYFNSFIKFAIKNHDKYSSERIVKTYKLLIGEKIIIYKLLWRLLKNPIYRNSVEYLSNGKMILSNIQSRFNNNGI